jgi:thiol-disulfide isomerase/thioredoxin
MMMRSGKCVWTLCACVALAACEGAPRRASSGASTSPASTSATSTSAASTSATSTSAASTPAVDGLHEVDGPGLIAAIAASGKKATLVNVWASWCGSCKHELPMLVELAAALETEGVATLLVSVDKPEARKDAVALLDTLSPRPQSFIVKGALGPFKRALNPRWKGALPATALYDAAGELVWFWPGPVLEHEITNVVTPFLAGQPLEGPTLVEPSAPPQNAP